MEMAGVKAEEFLACDGVAEVKFVRADGAALCADTKEFWLDGIKVILDRKWFFEDGVERGRQALARGFSVGGRVLEAIRNPHVCHARRFQRFAYRSADFASPDAVLDPELADCFVGMRKRETVRGFRMREASGVKIKSEAIPASPGDPIFEMRRRDFIAVHFP